MFKALSRILDLGRELLSKGSGGMFLHKICGILDPLAKACL